MPRVFSYGSLQTPAVQLATFGRRLSGHADTLAGFERATVRHGDRQFANLTHCAHSECRVDGMAFELSESELQTADGYERADSYTRIAVTLASGLEAWVYVDAESLRG